MFKETPEGQTHYENDGCGEPAHNPMSKSSPQEKCEHGTFPCFSSGACKLTPPQEEKKCACEGCNPKNEGWKFFPPQQSWDNLGTLTFDDLKNILEVCNAKDVHVAQDCLIINFVPKSATGKVWQELKEKMLQITKK